jgi:hypothetical protein
LPIESWRDADLADKTARRNAGLDNEERSQIEVNLALVDARLEAMDLPNEPTERGLTGASGLPAPRNRDNRGSRRGIHEREHDAIVRILPALTCGA